MLGILAWSVVGISGGGPYAVASPAADPGGVLRAMVVAGIGPWTLFAGPQPFENERPFHQMAGRGEIDAAWSGLWDIDPADVTCPVSLVHGKTDPVCPPQHGEWYQPPFVRHVLLLSRNDASGRSAGA
jgi:hypothetical protein